MPLYVADYIADTGHLSAAEHGAYLMLIMHYWRAGSLPTDEKALGRISRMSDREWKKSRDTIAAFFDAGWKHERIENELKKTAEKTERRIEAGSRGGHAKALKSKEAPLANAMILPAPEVGIALASSSQPPSHKAATAASSADAAKFDLKEVERRCVQATGWHSTDGFSAIEDLITEGHDLEDRILPMLRTIAGELKNRGKPAPDRWAFALKTIRDPSRRPMAEDKPVDMVWITEGSQGWKDLVQFGGKRESLLRMMLRTDGGGKEGLWWAVSHLPSAQPVKQGEAA
jgi:uncharacterized protein YdaU (DUF1376 family)